MTLLGGPLFGATLVLGQSIESVGALLLGGLGLCLLVAGWAVPFDRGGMWVVVATAGTAMICVAVWACVLFVVAVFWLAAGGG